MRRLPVYLLIDCSESMVGEPIAAVQSGVDSLLRELRSNSHALETAFLGVIAFSGIAKQIVPLTDITQFKMPELILGSGTALGAALNLLEHCLANEVVKTTPEKKGDWKAICFILTDGVPTDDWKKTAARFKLSISGKKAHVIAVACGQEANFLNLQLITEQVVAFKTEAPETFAEFFRWVSASVSLASQQLGSNNESGINLEKLPQDKLKKIDGSNSSQSPVPPRVYIHERCMKSKGLFIVQLVREQESRSGLLIPVAAHKVEKFNFGQDDEASTPRITTAEIEGMPACPYCGNRAFAMCSCGRIHCAPEIQQGESSIELTCPWCEKRDRYVFGEGHFDFSGGRG